MLFGVGVGVSWSLCWLSSWSELVLELVAVGASWCWCWWCYRPALSCSMTSLAFKVVEEPQRWGNFKTGFIWFHRPLSAYWKAITQSGLKIVEFEEPGAKIYDCPTAVLFLLEKPE